MENVNFRMLTIAREARGLTQADLVSRIPNLTQGNYSRMEKGLLSIPGDTLKRIAEELNFLPGFFIFNKSFTGQTEYLYRKRSTMPRKAQIKLEATFDLLRFWIEGLLNDIDIPDFLLPSIEVRGNNTPEEIAKKIRILMKLPRGPVHKLVNSIERQGIIVYFLKNAPEKFDGTTILSERGQIIIVINALMSDDRKRHTLAHEFGHNIMHIPFSPVLDSSRDLEEEADRFAAEFLMPEFDIRSDLIQFKMSDLPDLKHFWKSSKAALIRRAYTLNFINYSKYTSMMIELSRVGERKVENHKIEIDEPRLLSKVIDSHFSVLNYTKNELCNIISISVEDFNQLFLGKDPVSTRLRIAL